MELKTYFIASDVLLAEQESDRSYLSLTMRLLSTRANRNRQGVTEAFIDEIVGNQEKYACLPLYADKRGLVLHNYNRLGHMYDERTGTFGTDQIGGYCSFAKVNDEFGVSLYGEARVPKREAEICAAIQEMYVCGKLNFSFEISYVPEGVKLVDGVMYVDAYPGNALTGMAVVSVPAYPEATALALVAEQKKDLSDLNTETSMLAEGTSEEENKDEVSTMNTEQKDMIAEEEAKAVETEAETEQAETEQVATASTSEVVNVDTLGTDTNTRIEQEAEPAEAVTGNGEVATAEENQPEETVAEPEPQEATASEEPETTTEVEEQETVESLKVRIAELEAKLADYASMKAELDAYHEKEAQEEHARQVAKAESFAKRQGLDLAVAEVREAVDALDYEKIADIVMASEKEEPVEEPKETASVICESMTIETAEDNTYGGLIANV